MAFNGHLATANDTAQFGGAGSHARLRAVVVGTKAASAVVTVYNGTSTADDVVATIDAATASISLPFWGLQCPKGVFAKLTGGNADVTVVVD